MEILVHTPHGLHYGEVSNHRNLFPSDETKLGYVQEHV